MEFYNPEEDEAPPPGFEDAQPSGYGGDGGYAPRSGRGARGRGAAAAKPPRREAVSYSDAQQGYDFGGAQYEPAPARGAGRGRGRGRGRGGDASGAPAAAAPAARPRSRQERSYEAEYPTLPGQAPAAAAGRAASRQSGASSRALNAGARDFEPEAPSPAPSPPLLAPSAQLAAAPAAAAPAALPPQPNPAVAAAQLTAQQSAMALQQIASGGAPSFGLLAASQPGAAPPAGPDPAAAQLAQPQPQYAPQLQYPMQPQYAMQPLAPGGYAMQPVQQAVQYAPLQPGQTMFVAVPYGAPAREFLACRRACALGRAGPAALCSPWRLAARAGLRRGGGQMRLARPSTLLAAH